MKLFIDHEAVPFKSIVTRKPQATRCVSCIDFFDQFRKLPWLDFSYSKLLQDWMFDSRALGTDGN